MAVKAKEKEMKDEKEAERHVSAPKNQAPPPFPQAGALLGLVMLTARTTYRNG